MNSEKRLLRIMVSSTVYGIEELLERVYVLLTSMGYEVWMSHKGTIPLASNQSAFENCLNAVEQCDLFLGIITTSYGSGVDSNDSQSLSITHHEILRAIELDKPRWLLAYSNVIFARSFLNYLGYRGRKSRGSLRLAKNTVFTDLRVIDLYEDAIRDLEKPKSIPLEKRKGNWVQKYGGDLDSEQFVISQFVRYHEVEEFISTYIPHGRVTNNGETDVD